MDELRGLAVLAVLACHLILLRIPSWQGRLVVTGEGVTNRTSAVPPGPRSPVAWIDGCFERGYPPFVMIQGWAALPGNSPASGVTSVLVSVDAGPFSPAVIGSARPDVLKVYPTLSERCGWTWGWALQGFAPGRHVVKIRVRTDDGELAEYERTLILSDLQIWPRGARWTDAIGQSGVDMFFLISGFLITGILLRTKGSPGYFRTFYARRAWRILPLAAVVVFLYGLFRPETRTYGWYCLFFCANLPSAVKLPTGFLSPFWSLAVEEQFYMLMPALVSLVPKRHLGTVIGGLCLALAVPRLVGVSLLDGLFLDTPGTLHRVLPIAIGAWLAIVRDGCVRRPILWLLGFAFWIVILLGTGGRLGLADGFSLMVLPALVWLAVSGNFAIRNSLLRFIGIHCYGIYLMHGPLLEALNRFAPSLNSFWFTLLWLGIVLAAAFLSFRYFERPLLSLAPTQPGIPPG